MRIRGTYKWMKNYYTYQGKTKARNSETGKWEKHVLLSEVRSGELISVDSDYFEKMFSKVPERIK